GGGKQRWKHQRQERHPPLKEEGQTGAPSGAPLGIVPLVYTPPSSTCGRGKGKDKGKVGTAEKEGGSSAPNRGEGLGVWGLSSISDSVCSARGRGDGSGERGTAARAAGGRSSSQGDWESSSVDWDRGVVDQLVALPADEGVEEGGGSRVGDSGNSTAATTPFLRMLGTTRTSA
ncbi:unnamed protein product, partial [Discosporangium mesarthrocarpum]